MTLLRRHAAGRGAQRRPPDASSTTNALGPREDLPFASVRDAFYSDFEPLTRVLRYANAAHNPPLDLRREGYRCRAARCPRPLLIACSSKRTRLPAGGARTRSQLLHRGVRKRRPGRERFDEDRLIQCLQSAIRCRSASPGHPDRLSPPGIASSALANQLDDEPRWSC